MTKIYLIRHGESLGNAQRMYLGHTDLDLSPLGYLQAEKTAEHLADVAFSAVYSSDLLRAYNTALPHAKMRGLEARKTEKLRELHIGEWEGALIDDLLRDERFTKGWKQDFGNFTLPEGECVADGADRIYGELERIANLHGDEAVVAVFHAAAIRAFWCKMLGIPKDEWAKSVEFPKNASYSVVEYENGRFFPLEYSCDGHLGELKQK